MTMKHVSSLDLGGLSNRLLGIARWVGLRQRFITCSWFGDIQSCLGFLSGLALLAKLALSTEQEHRFLSFRPRASAEFAKLP
ncbi:hypothetical protein GUITHDRAFT_153775 [Guillardia theta CCMP2712]|uniref:Uncharacterized protein n=1 Tax=Guillardia theta (strain CCMP2712) TaxID=905079 RepID=L1J0E5_GUITC|nr:hypothetical protein GUITHDRAFT_153775 [Guillardia theta CCMP2712]EKX41565.1 hypothetical protein GUITHDRAFT_153775 [Guillardia theta CCMP2712]|eukprot:XP_005828545.1 hypothetical protein GUITHDRAFT_153775 [Guillardia theta CCMP2712]